MQYHHLQIDLGTVFSLARDFLNNLQFVMQFGLMGIFFAHMIPSIFFIAEGIVIAAVVAGIPHASIVIFATLGGTIGDFLWYALGYYSYRKLKKDETMKFNKDISKFKRAIFLYSAFPGGEALMIYAGVRHYHYKKILPYVIASNALRSGLAVGIVTGVITFLPQIIKQIIF